MPMMPASTRSIAQLGVALAMSMSSRPTPSATAVPYAPAHNTNGSTIAAGQVFRPARPSPIPRHSFLREPRGVSVKVRMPTVTVGTMTLSNLLMFASGSASATVRASEYAIPK